MEETAYLKQLIKNPLIHGIFNEKLFASIIFFVIKYIWSHMANVSIDYVLEIKTALV